MVLYQVVTVREAAMMYYMAENTIKYHLAKGHLTYRKACGADNAPLLIDGASLIALWGEPKRDLRSIGNTNAQLS